jgi:hypothetical protein
MAAAAYWDRASSPLTIEKNFADRVAQVYEAVIDVPEGLGGGGRGFAQEHYPGLHPMAVANATPHFAVLVRHGRRYRYETWVAYRSRRPYARRDLPPPHRATNTNRHRAGRHGVGRRKGQSAQAHARTRSSRRERPRPASSRGSGRDISPELSRRLGSLQLR